MPVRCIASPPTPSSGMPSAGPSRTAIPIPSLQTSYSTYSSYPSTSHSSPPSSTEPPPRPARSPRRLTMTRSAPAPPAPAAILPPPRSSSLLLSPTSRGPKAPFTPIAPNTPWLTQGPFMQRPADGQGLGVLDKGKGKEVHCGSYVDRREIHDRHAGQVKEYSHGAAVEVEQTHIGQHGHVSPTRPTVWTAPSDYASTANTSPSRGGLAVDIFASPVDTLFPSTPRIIPSIHSVSPGTPRKTSPLSSHTRSPVTPRKEPIPLLLLQQRYLKSSAVAAAAIQAHYPSATTTDTSSASGQAKTQKRFNIQDHPDVLDHILRHVRKPAPKANDGAVRSDFRQPDLVACMRVSTVFNRATAPILYKRVITDELLLLLEGIGQFAVRADVPSKLECLRYIRHFTLEYPDLDRHLPFRQALLSDPHAPAKDVKRRRAALVQEEEHVLASLEAALAILSAYVDVSDGNQDLRFDRYNTYPLRLTTLALGGNLSHIPEQLEIKASHGGCDRTFPKKGFFWCATRDQLWNSLVIPSRPRLICMHPLAQEMFLPCFKYFTTPPEMCLHVADWVNPPLIKPAPKDEITIKHSRPHRTPGTRDTAAKENPFFRTGRGERLFAIGRNAACWTDDGDERDLACEFLVEYSAMSLVGTLRDGAQKYHAAEARARAKNEEPVGRDQWSRCNVEIYASSDVPSRRHGVLSEEDQHKIVNKAWDKAIDELGEDALGLWDLRMGLLEEALECGACGA